MKGYCMRLRNRIIAFCAICLGLGILAVCFLPPEVVLIFVALILITFGIISLKC